MIELITGLPGNAKTLFTISQVTAQAARENRPVFYHGIPELTLPWTLLDDPKKWASVPPNSIVVIDEAQKTFRNRSLGSVPPDFVTDLETHRHLGIDLVLITQHPSLIDPAVRRLSGRHRHLVRIWGMEATTVHKWDSVKDNCDKSRADSEKTKWGFDKRLYGVYKSAEVHTMKRSIPARVKLLMVLPLVLLAAAWFVWSKVTPKTPASVELAQQVKPGHSPSVTGTDPEGLRFDPMADAKRFVQLSTPRVEGLPHTAPKYDELTKPTVVPVPAACIRRGNKCKCLTQQGTPMEVGFNMCVSFAANGWFQEFDPNGREQSKQSQQNPQSSAHPGLVASASPPSSPGANVAVLPYTPPRSAYSR